jgi:hypothetical protein
MIVKLPQGIFAIKFEYSARITRTKSAFGRSALVDVHKRQIVTICDICVKDNENRHYTIASGMSIKHAMDKFDKGKGRRISLGLALKQIKDRDIRESIWAGYAGNHKDGFLILQGK